MEFVLRINGKKCGRTVKVLNSYYPEEYAKTAKAEEASYYDYGVLELDANVEEDYGYFGIDMEDENVNTEEIEVCGYPEKNKMYSGVGAMRSCEEFIYYRMSTQQGQSGSPIFKREKGSQYVIGVHFGAKEENNVAVRLTP